MDPHEPDTPGSDPVQALQSKRTAGSRYGNQEYEPSENGHDRGNDQAVFDLSMVRPLAVSAKVLLVAKGKYSLPSSPVVVLLL